MVSDILSDREIRKFAQQIKLTGIGLSGQEKIKKARILVIGAGGKGTAVLQALVATGVGYIGICDNYPVEEPGLPRQCLYGENDIGKQKAIVSRQHLLENSGSTNFALHNICLSETNIRNILHDYDIILDATDNFTAHYLISDAVIDTGKPMVFGSVFQNTAQVTVFNYNGGPSLRCHFPVIPHNSSQPDDEGTGAINMLYSITGNLMASETIKIILGSDTILNGKLLHFNLQDYNSIFETITKNPDNFK
jgi:molybdopterin/thiamine biosynthesis adenylyltransferase